MLRLFSLIVFLLLAPHLGWAHEWAEHQREIEDLERDIYKLQTELDELVERKNNTRDRARIEETLQRIVEIHGELISLRKSMDSTRDHLKMDHPDKAHILDDFDSRSIGARKTSQRYLQSPISRQLDELMIKVQFKYSQFIKAEEPNQNLEEVDQVVESKQKKKREREADIYLRKRSKIKLVK